MTFPEPIFILDSENRADKVAAKFAGAKTIYRKKCTTFDDMRQILLQKVFGKYKQGTIVIDSGSDLQTLRELEYLQETGQKKVYPKVNFSQVRQPIKDMIDQMKDHGFHFVITGRLKDEYKDDTKTGELTFEGYNRLPYLVDIHLRLNGDDTATVYKNSFRTTAIEQKEPLKNPSYTSVIENLVQPAEKQAEEMEKVKSDEKKGPQEPQEDVKDKAESDTPSNEENVPQEAPERPEGVEEELEYTWPDPQPDDNELEDRQQIVRIYNHGIERGLEDGSLKRLLWEITGKDSTKGLSKGQVRKWHTAMDAFADSYFGAENKQN